MKTLPKTPDNNIENRPQPFLCIPVDDGDGVVEQNGADDDEEVGSGADDLTSQLLQPSLQLLLQPLHLQCQAVAMDNVAVVDQGKNLGVVVVVVVVGTMSFDQVKEHLDDSVNYSSLKCLLVNEVLKKMTELNHDSVIEVGILFYLLCLWLRLWEALTLSLN